MFNFYNFQFYDEPTRAEVLNRRSVERTLGSIKRLEFKNVNLYKRIWVHLDMQWAHRDHWQNFRGLLNKKLRTTEQESLQKSKIYDQLQKIKNLTI
jgi:hypothetical protein